ncbi:MAG: 2-oxoglutarate dehydrogenase E1 component [Verrucomicrobiota bacterium]
MHEQIDSVPANAEAGKHLSELADGAQRASTLQPAHAELIEEAYARWKDDPGSVEPSWQSFFMGFELGTQQPPAAAPDAAGGDTAPPLAKAPGDVLKQAHIYNLLFAYRTLGHYIADLDPLKFNRGEMPELGIEYFKFSPDDLDRVFDSGKLAGGGDRTLREIVEILRETYCGKVGIEYMHIQNFEIRRWVRDRVEGSRNQPDYGPEKKQRILTGLLEAEGFERFLHTKYTGQKRFSLEGAETLIPVLDAVVDACPGHGIQQIVMGMAHRGRLNVLANLIGKDYHFLFAEFSENYVQQSELGDGDVKYHLGFESMVKAGSGEQIGISLAPNPSHLEAVGPVVEGKARAWQRRLGDTDRRESVVPILIHGDAAIAAQGVVMETLNMSQLEGYRTGGTVHIVINNQIGFTTMPQDARSSAYCTSVAKMLGVPIIHVNGDDAISAVYAIEMALDFRQKFHRDIFVDIVCYRRYGHNEGDEPSFTQPDVYKAIKSHPNASERILKKMLQRGEIDENQAGNFRRRFEAKLNKALKESKAYAQRLKPQIRKPVFCPALMETTETKVPLETLRKVGLAISREPDTIKVNPKIKRLLSLRRDMIEGKSPIDWAFAEHLAFGTLLEQGIPVRLSGQDSRRGTFSQRHSSFYDVATRERYIPLKHISDDQAAFCVYNSPLSEYAVMGFDYGYDLDYPSALIIWEAQFGDFVNGAQILIDQYLMSGETKWGVTSSLVLLLPHGMEGQGPEHSSGRMERFLQGCAEDNVVVANCTMPHNYFHLMRRQKLRQVRKPLIVFTPKMHLRTPLSELSQFTDQNFEEILPDPKKTEDAKRIVFCSGKVWFDLDKYRDEQKITDTAIIRLEQIYPLHRQKLKAILARHSAHTYVWCQEENVNMGARAHIVPKLREITGHEIKYSGRDASASPATGARAVHLLEQQELVEKAFTV